jgi:hypothetical protein
MPEDVQDAEYLEFTLASVRDEVDRLGEAPVPRDVGALGQRFSQEAGVGDALPYGFDHERPPLIPR